MAPVDLAIQSNNWKQEIMRNTSEDNLVYHHYLSSPNI